MKALIRKRGETITEDMNLPGINWDTGYPLTDKGWSGGPYTLVQNYDPQEDPSENYEEVVDEPEQVVIEENDDDYVVIDGKRYSKAELRSLIE